MIFYFFIFTLIGFLLYKFFDIKGVLAIIVISVLWGSSSGAIWGFASLGEMFLGFYFAQIIKK